MHTSRLSVPNKTEPMRYRECQIPDSATHLTALAQSDSHISSPWSATIAARAKCSPGAALTAPQLLQRNARCEKVRCLRQHGLVPSAPISSYLHGRKPNPGLSAPLYLCGARQASWTVQCRELLSSRGRAKQSGRVQMGKDDVSNPLETLQHKICS